MDHDAIIIGATPEGVTAALTGAGAGMGVTLVDPHDLLATGAAPPGPFLVGLLREALMEIRAAHRVLGRERTTRGLRTLFSRTLADRRREVVKTYHEDTRRALAASGVQVLRGRAALRSAAEVVVAGEGVHRAPVIVLATGSRPRRPRRFGFDDRVVCDCDSIADRDRVPGNLVVVGADLLGCEFSCMFAALGSNVTLVDRRNRLLRFVDADLREVLHDSMQRSGVTVVLGESVEGVEIRDSSDGPYASVTLGSGRVEISECVLVAAGASPDYAGLDPEGLERAGVERDPRGFLHTGDRFETSAAGIYAVGGIVDGLASTSARMHQGRVVMLHAAGVEGEGEIPTPMVIGTVPEIAMVGLSEEACGMLDVPHVVGRSGLGRNLRARTRGEAEGLMKLVVSTASRQLLGVHVISPSAAEVVGLGAALLAREGTVEEIASIGLSPGSLSEAYHRAALDALSRLPATGARPVAPRSDPGSRF